MKNQPEDTRLFHLNKIGANELKVYFISQLNYIYCVKSHLQERLPELLEQANFIDLRQAIIETMDDVDRQIKRMDAIFILLGADYLIELSSGMVGMIDDAFNMINKQSHNVILRDLSMLFYLQNIESLEMASFQVLELAATKMKDKRIKQLLRENYDEAKDDRALFVLITAKYLVN